MRPTTIRRLTLAACVALLLPAASNAQMMADEVLRDFKINGDFVLELDGNVLKSSEVFFSERAVAYLVMAPELASPVMISPRARSVQSVHLMKVIKKQGGGAVDILADAELVPLGSFTLQGTNVVFSIDGKGAKLMPKPWALGRHNAERLKKSNPEYAFQATQYTPGAQHLEALRNQSKEVKVMVYFGSWCPHCKRMVPRILRVAEELAGSKVDFEFYGLPSPLTDDPEAKRADVHGVPTMLVFVDGKEAKRFDGNGLQVPEASIRQAVGG